jgi:hypothetical protein
VAIRFIHFPKTTEVPGAEAVPQGDRSASGAMPAGDARRRVYFRSASSKRIYFRPAQ